MKIKLLTSLAGIHHSFVPDDVVDRDDAEGQRLIDAGIGERAPDDAKITAVEPTGEVDPRLGDPRYAAVFGSDLFGPTIKTRYGDVQLGVVVRSALETSALSADEWNALAVEERDALITAEAIGLGWQDESGAIEVPEPVSEPIGEPVAEPVAPVAEPVAPASEPVAEPVPAPIAETPAAPKPAAKPKATAKPKPAKV